MCSVVKVYVIFFEVWVCIYYVLIFDWLVLKCVLVEL